MPFRLKKTKGSSKFSQFLTHHLQSSKRVETGFPTSLVDIFVMNRDRMSMRKSPMENRHQIKDPCVDDAWVLGNQIKDPEVPEVAADAGVLDPIIPTSSPPLNLPNSQLVSPKGSVTGCRIADKIDDEKFNPIPEFSISNATGDCIIPNVSRSTTGGGIAKNGVVGLLMSVLKIFLVVCLALGTKRFVIGITFSAFALYFLELIGNKVYRKFYPSSVSINKRELVVQRLDGDINGGVKMMQNDPLDGCCDCSDHSGEIQIVKTKSCPEQMLSSGISLNAGDFDDIMVCEEDLDVKECLEKEEASSYGVPELLKHQCSRRAKMKSKMKKLIHKNLRKSKKTCSSLKSDGSGPLSGPLQSDTFDDQEQCNNMGLDCRGEEQEHSKSMILVCQEDKQVSCKEIHGDRTIIYSSGESEAAAKAKVEEEMEKPSQKGSGYMVLCLIVLFGLVGGRVVALVLALSWCMMLKILAWRSPMLR